MTLTLGKLDQEDLTRYRAVCAREAAMTMAATLYSASELESSVLRKIQMLGEFVERYGIDDSRDWLASSYSGIIYYTD